MNPYYMQVTASLFMRSNLTLRVEENATLLGTTLPGDAPMVYTRRECTMMMAHAVSPIGHVVGTTGTLQRGAHGAYPTNQ